MLDIVCLPHVPQTVWVLMPCADAPTALRGMLNLCILNLFLNLLVKQSCVHQTAVAQVFQRVALVTRDLWEKCDLPALCHFTLWRLLPPQRQVLYRVLCRKETLADKKAVIQFSGTSSIPCLFHCAYAFHLIFVCNVHFHSHIKYLSTDFSLLTRRQV